MTIKIAVILFAFAFSVRADDLPPLRVYPSGFSVVMKRAEELYASLQPNYRALLDAQTVALQRQDLPIVAPIATTDDNRVLGQVCISAGFIDLVNHICHAKAIDRIDPGYFDHYVKNVAQLCSGDALAQAPDIVDPRFWIDDVMKDQESYFNQVISLLTAINLSHHYLGHYAKYADKLAGAGDMVAPINNFLNTREWEASVRAGAVDSFNCAYSSTDGPRALFEAIDRMPQRPAWTAYIVPPQVDIKKLNKELATYERDFFRGHLK